jgi:hypothetical protein
MPDIGLIDVRPHAAGWLVHLRGCIYLWVFGDGTLHFATP